MVVHFSSMPEPNPDHSLEERVARWKLKMLDKNNNDVSCPGCLQVDAMFKKKIKTINQRR